VPETSSGPQIARFGDYLLDLRSGELLQNGSRRLLAEQPLRILALMVQKPGQLVTRDDLRRQLWADDTFVDFEHSVNAAMKRLREALGDSAVTPRFIETLPRRGYRFIGEVDWEQPVPEPVTPPRAPQPPAEVESPAQVATKPRRRSGWWILATGLLVVAAWLAWTRFHSPSRPEAAAELVRLTSTSGLNTEPALSPDGKLLAYASDRAGTGGFDIWVQPVGGGNPLRLTDDAADDAEPSFSPDGSEIVFSRRETGLHVVGALGGQPRLVVRQPWARTPRFSPDGKWIVYWIGFPASVAAVGVRDGLGSIVVVPSAGGAPRLLQPAVASARYPIWSPDGERILFLGEDDTAEKRLDWYLMKRDGSDLVKTVAVPIIRAAEPRAGPPIPGAFSADGSAVIFSAKEADRSSVWQIAVSSTTGRASAAPHRLTFGSAIERSPAVGGPTRVAFASIVENVDVWRVPLDGHTGVASGPPERVTDNAASDRLKSVSADGKTLMFISSRTNQDEIWVRDLATGNERQVTHGGADDASLSPNGSSIALARVETGTGSMAVVDSAGGPTSPLCENCGNPWDWSPDGKRVLFSRGRPTRILSYDLASHREAELTAHPKWNLQQAHFSRDGRWVAFHTTNSPNLRQVYVAPAVLGRPIDPKEWVPVVTDHGCHPNWSADGSLLYYFSFRDGEFCPWVQKVDPVTKRPIDAPRAVLHLHRPRLRAASGAAATNVVQGGYLYFTATEATGNIWMLESGIRP
jgi:eukaryotic-like serine/threonine-protein kinase